MIALKHLQAEILRGGQRRQIKNYLKADGEKEVSIRANVP